MAGAGCGHRHIGTHHQQRPHAALLPQRVQHFVCGAPRARQGGFGDAPHAGDVPPRRRVGNQPVARQLVGFLAVFPAALAVALPGEAAVAAVGAPHQPQGQGDIDERQHIVRTLPLLFGAAPGQNHCRRRRAQHPRRPQQAAFRHAGDALHPFRPIGGCQISHGVKPGGAFRNIGGIGQAVPDQDVQQPVGEGGVGAGDQAQVQIGALRGGRQARVGDDQFAAGGALPFEVLHQGRHRFGGIAANQQNDFGAGQVRQGEREAPVHAESADAGRRCR